MSGYIAVTREVRESWVGQFQPATIGDWRMSDLRALVIAADADEIPDNAPVTFRSRRAERLPVHDIVTVAGQTRAVDVPPGAVYPDESIPEATDGE